MRKRTLTYLAAAAASLLLAAVPAAPALAATGGVLTVGAVGGTNVNVGDALTAALSGKDKTNPAASTGKATETVTGIAFTASSCTSSITGTTSVVSIGLKASTSPVATVTVSTLKLSVKPIVTVVLGTVLGNVTCYYGGTISGALSNTGSSLAFKNANTTTQTGSSSLCPASGKFTATYKPILDTTQASQPVFVN